MGQNTLWWYRKEKTFFRRDLLSSTHVSIYNSSVLFYIRSLFRQKCLCIWYL